MKNRIYDLAHGFKTPAWYPTTCDRDGSLLDSKFSGKPYLLPDEKYPHCQNCSEPMQLFIQLNFNTLPRKLGIQLDRGLLQLFYCTSSDPHCDSDCEANVALESDPGFGKLIRIVEPQFNSEEDYELPNFKEKYEPKCIIGWQQLEDLPSLIDLEHLESLFSPSKWEEIIDLYNFPLDRDKLGGYPLWIQGDYRPQCPRCQTTMRYFMQLDCEGVLPFDFGGNGCGHIFQCPNHQEIVEFTYECT